MLVRRKRAFTTRELVLSLFVVITMLPVVVSGFSLMSRRKLHYLEVSDAISTMQLRRILLMGYEIEVYASELSFEYQGKRFRLHMTNDHLILSPGTQIFYDKVEHVRFFKRNGAIYVELLREGEYEERCIAKEDSFSFDSFSNRDDYDTALFRSV